VKKLPPSQPQLESFDRQCNRLYSCDCHALRAVSYQNRSWIFDLEL